MLTTNATPAAACPTCGGWTECGGMSQHARATEPVLGRIGCICHRVPWSEPENDGTECVECGGRAYFLGYLGNVGWYRCRQCGMEVNAKRED